MNLDFIWQRKLEIIRNIVIKDYFKLMKIMAYKI